MLIALCFGFVLSFAGQTLTHRLQPVQSSGATWIVNDFPLYSFPRYAVDWNVGGASASAAPSYTFARIAACGQTSAHWLHWMQTFGVPDRDFEGEVSLLPFRRSHRPRAVDGERAHREQVAFAGQDHGRDLLHEVRGVLRNERRPRARGARGAFGTGIS